VLATKSVHTTGPASSLRVSIKDGVGNSTSDGHAGGLIAGCLDVALVKVEVVDAAGRVVPTADNNVTLSHTGPATFLGGGNGDPACHTSDRSPSRPAFHGLLLGVYASTRGVGTVTVSATAPGLSPAKLSIEVKPPSFKSKWWCSRLPEL